MSHSIDRLDPILDTITDSILVVDIQGAVLYANQAAEIILGRKLIYGQSLAIPIIADKNTFIKTSIYFVQPV